jgi:hypothetical protein
MSALLMQMAVCGALGGCGEATDRDPRPGADAPPAPSPSPASSAARQCARVTLTLTTAGASFAYPSAGCQVGSALIRFDRMAWDGGNRTLTVQVRGHNPSRTAVPLPLRLDLPANGKVVLAPPGVPPESLVPLNADSTLALDRAVWVIGVPGTLAAGDSTASRELRFSIRPPVTKARLLFVRAGETLPARPPAEPGAPGPPARPH